MTTTVELIATEIRNRMAELGVDISDWDVGKQAKDEHGLKTRVAWIHAGGDIQPAQSGGRQRVEVLDPDGKTKRRVSLRYLHLDVMDVQCHIWAETPEAFERLHQRVLSATRDVLGGASTPGRYAIATEAERSGKMHGALTKAVQLFTWRVPIMRSEDATTGELSPKMPTRRLLKINDVTTVYEFDHTLEV